MKKLVKSLSYLLAVSLMVVLLPNNVQAANYIYEWVGQNGTISADRLAHEFTNLQAGQTIQLSLILRNESDYMVRARNRLGNPDFGRQVQNGSYGIGSQTPYQDGTPSFLDPSSFVLNNNRFAYYEGEDVSHGRDVHISWTIKLKDGLADGVYNLHVRPVFEYVAWTQQIKNGKLLPSTDSDIFWRLVVGEGGWLTYANDQYGFSVDYPYGWLEPSSWQDPYGPQTHVGFGAPGRQDWQWGIDIDYSGNKTIDDVISDMGKQWDDRAETRENVSFNGINAVKAMITTNQYDWWESVLVVFERNGKIFRLSNGAIEDSRYETFYKSFKFTDKDFNEFLSTHVSFKYPQDWKLRTTGVSSGYIYPEDSSLRSDCDKYDFGAMEFDVKVSLYDSFADTVEYIRVNSFANNYNSDRYETSKTTSSGKKWRTITFFWSTNTGEHEVKYDVVELNDITTFYIFHWSKCGNDTLTKYQSVIDQILSTLSSH